MHPFDIRPARAAVRAARPCRPSVPPSMPPSVSQMRVGSRDNWSRITGHTQALAGVAFAGFA